MAPPRNRRPGFSRRAQYGLFLSYVAAGLGAAVGAVLLLLSSYNPTAFAAVHGVLTEVTAPVAALFGYPRRWAAGGADAVSHYFAVFGENARLRQQVADDATRVRDARTLAEENRRLRALLRLRDRPAQMVVAARLVASSGSSTRRYATLNAGFLQGVHPGQPVRGPAGLIGQVVEAGPDTARVLLVVDAASIVPVRRTRDSMPAIAAGRGDGLLDIRSAGVGNTPFRAGDTFVTSGTGGIFPPGVPVGRVVRDSRDVALAQPSANPDALDFAVVEQTYLPALPAPPAPAKPPR